MKSGELLEILLDDGAPNSKCTGFGSKRRTSCSGREKDREFLVGTYPETINFMLCVQNISIEAH